MGKLDFAGLAPSNRASERAKIVRYQSPSPDHFRIRNTQNYPSYSSSKSMTYKKRTKSGSQQLRREWAVERAKWPLRRRSQSTGSTQNDRRYCAFKAPAKAGETVCLGSAGGGKEPEIQRSLLFPTAPSSATGRSPEFGSQSRPPQALSNLDRRMSCCTAARPWRSAMPATAASTRGPSANGGSSSMWR
jgi:hypothetical protein